MKRKTRPIRSKLFLYFTLFAALILSLLWLLQTVFLQQFYEDMKTRGLMRVADELAGFYGRAGFEKRMERAAYEHSILVYAIDADGLVRYSADEHAVTRGRGKEHKGLGGWSQPPSDYGAFLRNLAASETGRIQYTVDGESGGKTLVLGVLLDGAALYISTPIDPLSGTVQILRVQLVYVSVAALLLGLVIAYFIARRFARPIGAITREAAQLAGGSFPETFDKGFCRELDELSDTLSYASCELSKVEATRRELIANVGHDLRTPLTMIKAYTELIRDISGDDKQKREANLSVIAAETDRLSGLVSDILSLSEAQNGGAVRLVPLDVSATVQRVLNRFAPIFEREGEVLETDIQPGQVAPADERRVEQVLYNLIANAMSYAGDDRVVRVAVLAAKDAVRVEVRDHGEGIPRDELKNIWQRYYKAKTHKRSVAGTGLGLPIVKEILERHGARFGVDSEVGRGSVFWFELKK